MTLSQDRQLNVESLFNAQLLRSSPKYRSGLKKTLIAFRTKNETINALIELHREYIQQLSDFLKDAYLEAYRAEGKLPDENDIVEITGKLSYWLHKAVADAVIHLPMDLGLSTTTEQLIRDTMRIIDKDLRNTRTGAHLDAKRKQEAHMNQRLLLEKEEKRYRVLKRIYDESGGNIIKPVAEDTLSEKEGIPKLELEDIIRYLVEERLIRNFTYGTVAIEHLGLKEIESSMRNPEHSTEHFQSTIIQNFYGTVHNVQTGNENTQYVTVNINPEFDDALSKVIALINTSVLGEVEKEERLEDLKRVSILAQKDKTPDVIEAATKRLNLVRAAFDVVKLTAQAAPYLQYLYHWFQS